MRTAVNGSADTSAGNIPCPVRTRCRVTPSDQMSLARPAGRPRMSSGSTSSSRPACAPCSRPASVCPWVVGVGQHLLEGVPGPLETSRPGERLHLPERAQVEGALGLVEAVTAVGVVPVHQAVGYQLRLDAFQGREESGVLIIRAPASSVVACGYCT